MGNRRYAEKVVQFMQKEVPTFDISQSKIISRDDGKDHTGGKLIKTLRQLSPSEDSFYVIMDDRFDVWGQSAKTLISVYPYVYFPNAREEIVLKKHPGYFKDFINEDIDCFLLYYGIFLKKLHAEYYMRRDNHNIGQPEVDIRDVLSHQYSTLFTGLS